MCFNCWFFWDLGKKEKSENLGEKKRKEGRKNLEKWKRKNSKYIAAVGAVDATENAFISHWNIMFIYILTYLLLTIFNSTFSNFIFFPKLLKIEIFSTPKF